jgi:DNA-binding transcriptional MerR regulator
MKDRLQIRGRDFATPVIIMKEYGIAPSTLYRWARRGFLPAPIKIGRFRYYDLDELEARFSRGE